MYPRKKALITGAGTGIGRGIALYFASKGVQIAVHCSHSTEGAEEVVRNVNHSGGIAKVFKADFTKFEEVEQLAEDVTAWMGGIDILVNNAGITLNERFQVLTSRQFDLLYTVNVKSPFFLIQNLLSELEKSQGAIVNLTSVHGLRGMQEHSIYAGTKGAIIAYTRALAVELAPLGIRVNAVAPGAVEVENQHKVVENFNPEHMGNLIPSGFIGQPEDISKLVWFLATDESRYIVGQTIVIDGGTTSLMSFTDSFRYPLKDKFGMGYVPRKEDE